MLLLTKLLIRIPTKEKKYINESVDFAFIQLNSCPSAGVAFSRKKKRINEKQIQTDLNNNANIDEK